MAFRCCKDQLLEAQGIRRDSQTNYSWESPFTCYGEPNFVTNDRLNEISQTIRQFSIRFCCCCHMTQADKAQCERKERKFLYRALGIDFASISAGNLNIWRNTVLLRKYCIGYLKRTYSTVYVYFKGAGIFVWYDTQRRLNAKLEHSKTPASFQCAFLSYFIQ